MKRHYQRWTPHEIKTLQQLVEEGHTTPEIARQLKRTPKAVTEKRWSLHIPSRRFWTEEDSETLKQLRKDGLTVNEISSRMGWGMRTIETRLTMLGLTKPIGVRYIMERVGMEAK